MKFLVGLTTLAFSLACITVPLAAPQFAFGQSDPMHQLITSARSQVGKTTAYDPSYQLLPYPGGDIPVERGVCTDVLIRAYRWIGYDLQKLVHEDIAGNFSEYPSKTIWGLTKPDTNIDHRRVPNLQTFFTRKGVSYGPDLNQNPPQPGDILTFTLPGGMPHIALVSDRKAPDGTNYLVIHNVGFGAQEEPAIGIFRLTGHYRYAPWVNAPNKHPLK